MGLKPKTSIFYAKSTKQETIDFIDEQVAQLGLRSRGAYLDHMVKQVKKARERKRRANIMDYVASEAGD